MKLKVKKKKEDYPTEWCCAARCRKPSELIDATKKRYNFNLPLCAEHWVKLTEENEEI